MLEKNRVETGGGQAEQPAGRDVGLGGFVRRHGLISFYALAFGLSWLAWLPYILSENGGLGILNFSYPAVLGVTSIAGILPGAFLGPLGGAFVVTAVSEGRPGLRRWTGRLFRFRVNWRWYALAFLGVPAIIVAGTLAVSPASAAGLRFPPLEALLLYVPFFLLQFVTTGLAEEPGWRDFALVRHQRRQGPLLGTLILGVLWATWHVPLFFTEWGAWMGGANLLVVMQFAALCVVLSVAVTWLFNRTGGSLPLAIVAHVSNNTFVSLVLFSMFTGLSGQVALTGSVVGFGVVAVVLVAATRGRLGYCGDPAKPTNRGRRPRGARRCSPGGRRDVTAKAPRDAVRFPVGRAAGQHGTDGRRGPHATVAQDEGATGERANPGRRGAGATRAAAPASRPAGK